MKKKTISIPNILFITRKYPPTQGGMEMAAYELSTAIMKQANVHLVKWGGANKWLPLVLPAMFVKSLYILMTKRIDGIYLQDGVLSPLGLVLKTLFGKKSVITIHGLDITYQNWLFQKVIPSCVRRMDVVASVSQASLQKVIDSGCPKEKTIFIPNGINDNLYQTSAKSRKTNKEKVILSVGRLVERKGVAWFIRNVLPQLSEPNIIYKIAGDGESRADIEQAILETKADGRVMLLGRVSDDEKQQLYNESDVFVMPNYHVEGDMEGFGIVLVEAASCELPIVASNVDGIPSAVVDGKNGILVKPKDAKAFANEVGKFLSDSKYAFDFGEAARKYTLENYSWDVIATRYISILSGGNNVQET